MRKFRPPWKCRTFGHEFVDVGVDVPLFANMDFYTTLDQCSRCKCGRIVGFVGVSYYTPDAMEKFLTKAKSKTEDRIVQVDFRKSGK